MKTNNLKYILAAGIVCCGLATTFSSCGDVLDEQPRSQFDPTFFNTKAGIEGGLTSLYAHLRYIYGNGPMNTLMLRVPMVTLRMPTSLVLVR